MFLFPIFRFIQLAVKNFFEFFSQLNLNINKSVNYFKFFFEILIHQWRVTNKYMSIP